MTSLTFVTATCNRPSLLATYRSVAEQLDHTKDRHVIVTDGVPVTSLPYMPKAFAIHGPYGNDWGHTPREFAVKQAELPRTSHVAFIDDDDLLCPWAVRAIRKATEMQPDAMILAKIQARKGVIWDKKELVEGNIGNASVIVPWKPELLGTWSSGRYAADFDFIAGTAEHLKVCWLDFVVQTVRQDFI